MSTAIFGGTFDPVHTGHVAMALSAIAEFKLSRLVVVPNGNPPHKTGLCTTDFVHRYNMVLLAFRGVSKVLVSDYESGSDRPGYSLYTMRHFRELYGEDTAFIIGMDSLLTIHKWYEYTTLLKENHFIVFRRKGDENYLSTIEKYNRDYDADIRVASMEYVDVSSTDIRKSFQNGVLPEKIVPRTVCEYIKREGLYRE